MRNLLIGILVVLVVVGCIYRFLQIFPYPIGTGEECKSPDGQFVASVTQYYDENFWGVSKSWVEFEIRRVGNNASVRKLITDPIAGAVFGSRTDTDVVFWSPDSKEVKFVFPEVQIKLRAEWEKKR